MCTVIPGRSLVGVCRLADEPGIHNPSRLHGPTSVAPACPAVYGFRAPLAEPVLGRRVAPIRVLATLGMTGLLIGSIRSLQWNLWSTDQHDSGFAPASGTASPASHHGTCVHPQSRIDPAIAAADVWQMRPCLPIGTPDRSARHNRGSFFGSQIPFEPSAPSALSNELRMFCILQDIRPAQAILIVCEPDLRMPAVVFPSAGALRAIAVTSTCRQSDGVPQPSRDIRSH
jgi:hypothetical protein